MLDEQAEVADRSATSRAYYAAFWHYRAIVTERIGPIDTVGADVHREVAQMLDLLDPDAADALFDLRRSRNVTDYAPEVNFLQRTARYDVDRASWLIAQP